MSTTCGPDQARIVREAVRDSSCRVYFYTYQKEKKKKKRKTQQTNEIHAGHESSRNAAHGRRRTPTWPRSRIYGHDRWWMRPFGRRRSSFRGPATPGSSRFAQQRLQAHMIHMSTKMTPTIAITVTNVMITTQKFRSSVDIQLLRLTPSQHVASDIDLFARSCRSGAITVEAVDGVAGGDKTNRAQRHGANRIRFLFPIVCES